MVGLLLKSQPYMKSLYRRFLTAAVLLAVSAVPAAAADKKPKLDQAVTQSIAGSLDVIIRVVPGGHDAVRARLAAKGHAVTGEHASINALSATINAGDLADLDRDPLVASVSLNAVVHAHETAGSPDALVTLDRLRPMVGSTAKAVTGVGVAV